jgi:hypothetical protein
MQIQNLQIFSSTLTADGLWVDVSNLVAMSIQVVGLESGSTIWVEASNDPNVMIDGAAIGPPGSAPVLSQFASLPGSANLVGGSNSAVGGPPDASQLPAQTYFVETTFVTKWGETTPSAESSLAVTAGNYLFVAAPVPSATQAPSVIGWNCYVGLATGAEVLQGGGVFDPQRLADGVGTQGGTVDPLGPSSSTHFALTGALPLQQNFSMVNGFQNTGFTPPGSDNSGGVNIGVNTVPPDPSSSHSQNLTTYTGNSAPNNVTDAPVAIFGQAAITGPPAYPAMAVWAPACMCWKFIRVRKTQGGTPAATAAYLTGQKG